MSTSLSGTYELPADVETTWRLMTGDRWAPALAARLKDDSRTVLSQATPDGGAVLAVSRRLPDGIPGFLAAFVPKDGRVTQTDTWGPARDGVREGTWEAAFGGAPGEIRGTTRLEPTPGGCRWVVEGHVKVKIPLVGGKAESFLAPLVEKLIARQAAVLRDEVAG
jgi:hypothetical protein